MIDFLFSATFIGLASAGTFVLTLMLGMLVRPRLAPFVSALISVVVIGGAVGGAYIIERAASGVSGPFMMIPIGVFGTAGLPGSLLGMLILMLARGRHNRSGRS